MIRFKLEGESIELAKLLKLTGLAESGGMAKHLIRSGEVKVNGVTETKKACKITAGSKIEAQNEVLIIE